MGLMAAAHREQHAYSGGEDRPLGGYLRAMATFASATTAVVVAARATGRRPPRLSPWDAVLLTLATHKAARLLAKDAVTSPIRAPFSTFAGAQGDAEVREEVRGEGVRHVVGELITCPLCLGPWVATALTAGYTFAPGLTRAATTALSAVAGSDFLQIAYASAQQRMTSPEQRDG